MKSTIEMTDLGLLYYYLELQIKQTEDRIVVSQQNYAKDLVRRFNMQGCNEALTAINTNELQASDGIGSADIERYRSMVGGLIYLTHTRPDILFVVGVVLKFMNNPTKHHLGTARRILRHVARNTSFAIWYTYLYDFKLCGFINRNPARSLDDRRSTSSCVFILRTGVVT